MAKKKFIKKAIKSSGALRRSAKKSEINKDGTLNLQKLAKRAKKTDNKLLARRVNLAKTLRKL